MHSSQKRPSRSCFSIGSQILGHMAVEAVAHIGTVGNILNDAVHFPELLHLETAETLCRGSVDGVKPAVCFLELIDLFVDIFQNFEGETAPSSAMDLPL